MRSALFTSFVLLFSLLTVVCVPSYDFSPPPAGADAAADATLRDAPAPPMLPDAPMDAGVDGVLGDAEAGPPPSGPHAVVSVGAIQSETGNAQQRHLVFAENDGRYWLFYIDADTRSLKTMASPDSFTWTAGASLALPQSNAGEGRNFSVAYADIGHVDVVHVALALNDAAGRATYHARGVVSQGALAWDAVPAALSSLDDGGDPMCDPDGPAVAVTPDGHVLHATGWNHGCDDYILVSNSVDTGQAWTPGFNEQFVAFVPWVSHNRQVSALQGADGVFAWDNGWAPGSPTNVEWTESTAGAWPTASGGADVYPDAAATMTFDDWSMCKRTALEVDLARRQSADGGPGSGRFDYYRLVANASAWTPAEALPDDPGTPGTGVVTLTDGTSILLFTVAADYAIHYARWNAGAWSPWAIAVPAPTTTTRTYLAGTGCEDKAHAVLLWTEGDTSFSVMALDVASLF